MKSKKFINFLLKNLVFFTLLIFLLRAGSVNAATMTLQASKNKVDIGNLFTVKVYVNSQDVYINNAEAVINFPNDLVEVVSVDSKSSLFTMWVESPTFSNAKGVVSFNGGIANPGYKGTGQLVSILFKAKNSGIALLSFSSPAIKANDGLGTDVLSGQNDVSVTVGSAGSVPPATTVDKKVEPSASTAVIKHIVLTSPTHPDQNAWYSAKNATLVWKNSDDIKALQVTLSTQSSAMPGKALPVDTTSRVVNDIDDGISYFIIRDKTTQGWSVSSIYKLQIDSLPPQGVSFESQTKEDGSVAFKFNANDSISGISYFKVSFDAGTPVVVAGSDYSAFLAPGTHAVTLVAFDKAGNTATYSADVVVSATIAPTIADHSSNVKFGSTAYINGQSAYPNATISISVKSAFGLLTEYNVKSDSSGMFKFESEPFRNSGDYELSVSVVNVDGTKSSASTKIKIFVEQNSSLGLRVVKFVFSFKMLIVLAILFLVALTGIGWYKFLIIRSQYNELKKQILEKEIKSKRIRKIPNQNPSSNIK